MREIWGLKLIHPTWLLSRILSVVGNITSSLDIMGLVSYMIIEVMVGRLHECSVTFGDPASHISLHNNIQSRDGGRTGSLCSFAQHMITSKMVLGRATGRS